jgi:hypothetical protein
MFMWDNKLYNLQDYSSYDDLPWEKDVANRQHELLVKTYLHFAPKT